MNQSFTGFPLKVRLMMPDGGICRWRSLSFGDFSFMARMCAELPLAVLDCRQAVEPQFDVGAVSVLASFFLTR